jgi:hypothetical protein
VLKCTNSLFKDVRMFIEHVSTKTSSNWLQVQLCFPRLKSWSVISCDTMWHLNMPFLDTLELIGQKLKLNATNCSRLHILRIVCSISVVSTYITTSILGGGICEIACPNLKVLWCTGSCQLNWLQKNNIIFNGLHTIDRVLQCCNNN